MNFSKKYLLILLAFLSFIEEATAMDAPELQGDIVHSTPTQPKAGSEPPLKVGAQAEWLPVKTVLMHNPGSEQFLGVLHPEAALFEGVFDVEVAKDQHADFVLRLERAGATVHKIRDVLLQGTRDEISVIKDGKAVIKDGKELKRFVTKEGEELQDLRKFAKKFLKIFLDIVVKTEEDAKELREFANPTLNHLNENSPDKMINQLSPEGLVNIILHNPSVYLERTTHNTRHKARYELSPLMNLMFLRDQMITTKRGIVLGNMNSPQRSAEPEIIAFVLKKLGIEPLYRLTGKACLEGGDFLAADDLAFIGKGLRTNKKAIEKLLKHKFFGTKQVAVVKDSWKNQEEMHLDTYFNIIRKDLVVLSDWRIEGKKGNESFPTTVDLYQLENDEYKCIEEGKPFCSFLKERHFSIIPVSENDQKKYALNFLTVAPNTILAIDGVSEKYKEALKDHQVNVNWMDFSALTKAYGAAHCLTQVIYRQPNTPESNLVD